jgi:hypothetical protein
MIPKEVEADELLIKAQISDWLFQLMSSNWAGYWIVQLSNDEKSLPMLIDLDHLAGFCSGLKKCIDAHKNPNYVAAKITSMIEIVASKLATPFNDEGSISITSNWESDPFITLNFYNNRNDSNKLVIRQSLHNADAMDFYNLLAGVYNDFPDKSNWEPRRLG